MTVISRLLPALLIAFAAQAARAQDFDQEIERPQTAAEAQDDAADAAEAADERKAGEGAGGIRYEDVLKDPDNIELNYKYAKSLIEAGDLKGAAATLERILMVDPALPKVRLTYGIVLYRLDSLREAQRELLSLRELPMPESLRAEIDEYLKRISRRLRRTNLSTRLGLGFQFDTNRNAGPTSDQRLFAGTPVKLATGQKEDDQSLIALARIDITHDLGTQDGHTLDFDYTFYNAEQAEIDLLDFSAHSWGLGGTYKTRYGDFKPAGIMTYAELDNVQYLRIRGFRMGWEKPINPRLSAHSYFQTAFQQFVNSTSVTVADERTGQETVAGLGGNYLLSPSQRLGFTFGLTDKDARQRYNAYRRQSMHGDHQWLLGKGRFLLNGVTVNVDSYDRADRAVSNALRKDTTFRFSSTFGMPLGMLAKPLEDLLWTVTYEHFNSDSNIINYDYYNNKFNMMFTYKWEL